MIDELVDAGSVEDIYALSRRFFRSAGYDYNDLSVLKRDTEHTLKILLSTNSDFINTLWPVNESIAKLWTDGSCIVSEPAAAPWLTVQTTLIKNQISSAHLVDVGELIYMFTRSATPLYVPSDIEILAPLTPVLRSIGKHLNTFIDNPNDDQQHKLLLTMANEKRFKVYAELASDWFWESDEALNYTIMSPNQKNTFQGFNNLAGKTLFDIRAESETLLLKKWNHFLYLTNKHLPFKNFEFEIKVPGGNRWISISGQPTFGDEAEFTGYLGTASDITYIKQRELEINAAKQAAEKANTAKSQFIAVMSHELRTPLNVVLGNLELLLQTQLDQEQQSMLEFTQTSTKLLQAIISDVLDFSKIEAGTLDIEKEVVDPIKLVNEVVAQFQRQAEIKGLQLQIQCEPGIDAKVYVSAIRVAQVLFNLIGNAIKFTDKGEVAVTVEQINKKLIFSVKDTGCGIENADRDKVFKPFEQVVANHKKRREGAGLGLSISQRLVELMKGDIKFTSTPNEGSTFTFFLPLPPVPTLKLESLEASKIKSRSSVLSILVAEDHIANQMLMTAMLKQRGHNVVIAENGKIAVERMNDHAIDIVLMDMMMPEMNGIEATKAIRSMNQFDNVPIIALTANVSIEDRQACIDAGMNDFLTKPLSGNALDNALNKWCG